MSCLAPNQPAHTANDIRRFLSIFSYKITYFQKLKSGD
nr:MAG TPA: hypothetical protein [Caudoviricetes sp.]